MRREVDLERHVRAEVCAGVRHLRHHVAVTARVEQLAKELEVEVRLQRRVVVEQLDVVQVAKIPDLASSSRSKRVLTEYEVLVELADAANVVVALRLLDAPCWPLEVGEPLELLVIAAHPPINAFDRPREEQVADAARFEVRVLRRRSLQRRRHRDAVVERERCVAEPVVEARRVASDVDRHLRRIEPTDLITPFVQVVAHPHVFVVRSHECVSQCGLDTPHGGHLGGPVRAVRRVLVGQYVEPSRRDVAAGHTRACGCELT